MIVTWAISANIENSIVEFLRDKVHNQSLQVLDCNGIAQNVNVYVGREMNTNWHMPLLQVYLDSKPDVQRLAIGSNKRLRSWQIIIDIRTLLPGQESNLGDWVEDILNDGFTVYDYTPNSANPEIPAKVELGFGRVDFVSSLPVPEFDDADRFDQNRYRITIKIWMNS